jgi:NAD(P)-dependent dehydrogenase (short-subunit alcohol dehydrogenase family)
MGSLLRAVYGDEVAILDYVRPGYPLARQVLENPVPGNARGLVLIKHGLVTWGETAKDCYVTLLELIERSDRYVRPRRLVGRAEPVDARALLPAIRGALSRPEPVVLHLDASAETARRVSDESFPELAGRGVATPEQVVRAGRAPAIVRGSADVAGLAAEPRAPEAGAGTPRIVAVPGLGLVGAAPTKRSAITAVSCYQAVLEVMENAEGVERFAFLDAEAAREIETWPLERRKVVQHVRKPFDGRIVVVIGAGGGIGRATAERFSAAGANVVAVDLQPPVVGDLRLVADVRDAESVAALFDRVVLDFGGLDVLFYSPGVAPELHPVTDLPLEEVERQLQIHYAGAVVATRHAATIMLEQGIGGRLVYNASKAAFAPGRWAAAYGAAKAALVHYVRNVANELGHRGITANYVNADTVDTPLFRKLVQERAAAAGATEADVLARYRERSVTGDVLIPPSAVADAVLFLASDQAAYTTGCVLTVGGGAEGFPR